nr:ShlB/FhaC/HecB family hemolysin secretion/activation protein [Polynucleobacter sp. MWH-Loch1C5]
MANLVQAAGPDAGSLLRDQQELDRLKNLPTAPRARVLEDKPSTDSQRIGETKILVSAFVIDGQLKAFTADELKALVQDLVGKELTFAEIQSAADRITRHYQAKGYFLASAIIPKQEVLNGVVRIFVNEGKLDSKRPFEIKGQDLRMPKERIANYVETALDGQLYQPSLERGLLNIADNPQMTATANIEPGDAPGSSRIIVETVEGPKIDGSVTADTYGSRYTGAFRLTGSVNLNNPSTYGDQFNATAITAPGNVFNLGRLAYALPIGTDGLRAGVSYTALNFHLNDKLATSGLTTGTAHNWNANLRYPMYRTALRAAYVGASYDWKNSYNATGGVITSDKHTDLYGLNLTLENADTLGGAGFTQLVAGVSSGKIDLFSKMPSYSDQIQANGQFSKTNLQLIRIQRATERLSLQLLGNAQWASKNLDGSEKIPLGGPTGIRAYPVGEASGDEGYKYSVDAKYVLATGTKAGDIIGSIFYDYGQIHQYKRPDLVTDMSTPNVYSLSGWGLGLDAIAAGKFQFKFGWARAIGSNPAASNGNNADGKSNRSRYWLLGMVTF